MSSTADPGRHGSDGTAMTAVARPDRLVERVQAALRESILNGDIPPGTHLSVPEIARRLEVSRTPAREALFTLERLGLVEMRPRRGAVVVGASPSAVHLTQVFELREALEGMSARLAAHHDPVGTGQHLTALLARHTEAIESGDVDAHVSADLAFHRTVTTASGNPRLIEAINQLTDQIAVLVRASTEHPGGMDDGVLRAHGRIARAIADGDGARAERTMREHIRAVLALVLAVPGSTPAHDGGRDTP